MDDEIDPLAEVGKTWSSVVSFIAPWAVEEQQQVRESPRGADVSDFSGPRDMKKPPPPEMNPMQNPPLQQVMRHFASPPSHAKRSLAPSRC
jgi:hypothetical protein